MPNTDPPPKARRSNGGTQTQAQKTTSKVATKAAAGATIADQPETPTRRDTGAAEAAVTADTLTTAVEPAKPGDDAEAQTPQAALPQPVDPFNYEESVLTLSLSFLPLAEGAAGRQVIVSVHSKNGTGKSVLPEFIAPLHEGALQLPKSVLALIERYRTVTLPKRKAEAEAKAAALAAKRPVTHKKGKDSRPEHVTASATTKRIQSTTSVKTQLKLSFPKGASKTL
ncbi:hypothetical protein H6F76_03365 [Leptolyngbya sp. FACHB-321]|uniref:hypothetical protein n=1 Tax=Leptolyngbya sp. FACHB-321 TaxID=2692807 RepID=UPI0016856488|nr:hypothetical protein [Leptolyngbya sp. FACHB-321]MBD2034087.1 hypothetical protein [Leptolyngbya sp. FACHB-321]